MINKLSIKQKKGSGILLAKIKIEKITKSRWLFLVFFGGFWHSKKHQLLYKNIKNSFHSYSVTST